MDLRSFRKQNAAYDDWSDEELAEGVHRKFYADMPRETFNQQVGYSPTPVQPRAVEQAPAKPGFFSQAEAALTPSMPSGKPQQMPMPGDLMRDPTTGVIPDLGPKGEVLPGASTAPITAAPPSVLEQIPTQVPMSDALKSTIKTWPDRIKRNVAAGLYSISDTALQGETTLPKGSAKREIVEKRKQNYLNYYENAVKAVGDNTPIFNHQPYTKFVTEVATVTEDMFPAIGGGLAFGPLMGQQAMTLSLMGSQVFGPAYMEGINAGETPGQALFRGFYKAGVETLTEKIPVAKLFERGTPAIKRVLDMTVYEGAQEAASSVLNDLYDKGTITPDMTMSEALANAGYEFLIGAGAGGVLGTAAAGAHKLIEPGKREQAGKLLWDLVDSGQINSKVAEQIAKDQMLPPQPGAIEPTGHMQKGKVGPPAVVKPKPAPAEKAPAPEVQQDVEDKAKILKALEAEQAAKPVEVVKEPAKVVKEPVEVVKEPVPEDTEALGDLLAKELDEQPAYHGSPHRFKEFKTKYIGTGEGAQAYGHGLYFAESEEVAGTYKRDIGRKITVDGTVILDKNELKGTTGNEDVDDYLIADGGNIDKAIESANEALTVDIYNKPLRPEAKQRMEKEYRPLLNKLLDLKKRGAVKVEEPGSLYEVDIPDEVIAKMLDWDAPLSEQPDIDIQEILDDIVNRQTDYHLASRLSRTFQNTEKVAAKWDGATLYQQLSGHLGKTAKYRQDGDKLASEYLNSLGIPGIKFFDQQSRGDDTPYHVQGGKQPRAFTNKQAALDHVKKYGGDFWGSERTRNFVVFDESTVTTLKRDGVLVGELDESPGAKYTIPTGMLKAVSKEIGPIGKKLAPVVKHDSDFASQVAQVAPEELTLLSPQQQAVFNGVMRDLKTLGLPDTATGSVRAFMVPAQRSLGVHKSVQPKHDDGSIVGIKYLETIAKDTTGHTRMSLLQTAAHEIGHSVDTGHTNRGQNKVYASLSSPLFGNPVSSPGPIIQELLTVYNENLMELSRPLEYPMKYLDSIPDFQSLVKKTGGGTNARALINKESFAQLFSYYYTYGRTLAGAKGMAKHMPTSFQFMEVIHEILSTSKSVAERDASVREAFRTFTPGRVPSLAQRGQPGKASPESGQAGQGAGLLQDQTDEAIQPSTDAGGGPVTETPAFKKWFGDSKVVDESGTPLVVYHGTDSGGFREFDPYMSGEGSGNVSDGFYFTESKWGAGTYSRSNEDVVLQKEVGQVDEDGYEIELDPTSSIYSVYLSIQNPLEVDFEGRNWDGMDENGEYSGGDTVPEIEARLRDEGYDGAIISNLNDEGRYGQGYNWGNKTYIALEPTQIKSAIDNRGTFDLLSPNIDENAIMQPTGFEVADERAVWDKTARIMQDKFQRLYVTQGAIREQGGDVTVGKDAYAAEERMHGKVENDFKVLENEYIEPLADILADRDISIEDLDQYLYARHAPERNRHIATQRDDMPDGGSGMFTADAEAEQARLEAKHGDAIEIAADAVWRMLDHKRSMMEDMSLERGDTIDIWQDTYDYYVPLKGLAEDSINEIHPRIGKGLSIKGPESKRAYGRRSRAKDITTQVISDTSETIMRARKNEVGQHFLYLVQANPNPAFWEIYSEDNPDREERQGKMQNVPMHMDPRYFGVKFHGKQYYVKMTDVRLAKAMQNLGVEKHNTYVQILGATSRFLSTVNTSLNPEFMVSNFARDIQTAVYNILAETDLHDAKAGGEKLAWKMVKDTPIAGKSMWRALRDKAPRKGNQFDRYAYDFMKDGGKTGFFDSKDLAGMQKHVNNLIQMNRGGFVGVSKKMIKSTAGFIEDANGAVENGVRLSAYINAREAMEEKGIPSGQARKQAASLAKNLTVNFNRRGELSTALNAHWMFFNASVQGTAQFSRTMLTLKKTENGRRLNIAQKAAIGMVAFGYMLAFLNRWISDDDKDGRTFYDKIPGHVKERNLVLMKGDLGDEPGDYWQVPLPYGYNIFHVLGTSVNDTAHGTVPITEGAINLTQALLGSFAPLGMSDSENPGYALFKTVLPTVLTPAAEIGLNENFFGSPVWREDRYNDRTPDSSLSFNTTKKHYKAIAKWMNETTGGSMERRGGIDVSPDALEHWFEFATGGAGKFIDRSINVAWKLKDGVPLKDREIPFWRKISAQYNEYRASSDYYDRRSLALTYQDTYSRLKKEGKGEAGQWRSDHPQWFTLISDIKRRDKALRRIRKDRNVIRVDDEITEAAKHKKLERIQKDMNKEYTGFNLLWNRLIEKY